MLPSNGQRASLAALATGVAVVEAVATRLPGRPLGIHWPNDVMVGPRKLAGILIEVTSGGQFVVGVGLNVNNTAAEAPAELQSRVTTLRDLTGHTHDLGRLLIDLLQQCQRQWALLAREPEAIARRTDALCLQRGRMLSVRQGGKRLPAVARASPPTAVCSWRRPTACGRFTRAWCWGSVGWVSAPVHHQ